MTNDPSPIRILCVDDHALVRDGIASLLGSQEDMQVVAAASTGLEALEEFRKHLPDITLMDLRMPDMNGIDAMIAILNEFPNARFIVLTTYSGDVEIVRALRNWSTSLSSKGSSAKGTLRHHPHCQRRPETHTARDCVANCKPYRGQ